MSAELLRAAFYDAQKLGLCLETIRGPKNDFSGKYNFPLKELRTLFSKEVWEDVADAGGHTKLKNRVTGIVINYSNHKDPVDPGAIVSIAEKIQDHINFLGNQIFGFKQRNFKEEPDFKKIAGQLSLA